MTTREPTNRPNTNLPFLPRYRDSSIDSQSRLNSSYNDALKDLNSSATIPNPRVNLPMLPHSRAGVTTPDRVRRPPSVKRASAQDGSKTPNHQPLQDRNFNLNNYMESKSTGVVQSQHQSYILSGVSNSDNNIYNTDGTPLHFHKNVSKTPLERSIERANFKAEQIQEADLKIKFTIDEMSEESALQQLNQKLQKDLSELSDQFLDVYVENDRLQKLHKQMVVEQEKTIHQIRTEYDIIRIELEAQKKLTEILLEQEKAHNEDLQATVQRLKDSLMLERDEKIQVLKEIQELKERMNKYLDENYSSSNTLTMDPNEKQRMSQRLAHVKSELEMCKTLLIEKELKIERELSQRTEIGQSTKRKTRYSRIYYVGETRNFQDMLILLEKFDTFPLNSKDRLIALEELCVYMSYSDESISKLRGFKATAHCTRSLQSTNQAIALRALHAISFLCQYDQENALTVVELGGVSQIREYLDSADKFLRIEAMAAFEAISPFPEAIVMILRAGSASRIISLLEEGLQLENEYGAEMAILSAKTLSNICMLANGIHEIEVNGGLYTVLRCIRNNNHRLRGVGIKVLANCSMEAHCRTLICDLRAIKDVLILLSSHEPETALNAARALVNLSHKDQVKEDIRLEGGGRFIFSPLEYGDDEMKTLILMILLNLCKFESVAASLCQYGLLNKLAVLIKATSNEIQRLSAHCISLLLQSGIPPEYVYNNSNLTEIIDSLDPDDDLETANFCFNIVYCFLLSPITQKLMLDHIDKIYYFSRKLLEYKIDITKKLVCFKVIPKTLTLDNTDILEKLYQHHLDEVSAARLQESVQINNPLAPEVITSLLDIFTSVAEQEYRLQRQEDEIKFVERCITNLNISLIDNISKLLEVYSHADKLNWDVIKKLIHTIEVYSQNESNVTEFLQNDILKPLMAVFDKAKQHREESVVETVISCLAYYTNKQEDWFTLIKPDFIEFLCSYLMSPDQFMSERAKHCLYDLSFCPMLAHVLVSLQPNSSLKPLIYAYNNHPASMNTILQNICTDEALKRQFIASLPHKLVLMGQGRDMFEFEFMKRDLEGRLPPITKQRLYTKRQLLDQTFGNHQKFQDKLVHTKPKDRRGLITENDRENDRTIEEAEVNRLKRKDPLRPFEARRTEENTNSETKTISQGAPDLGRLQTPSISESQTFVDSEEGSQYAGNSQRYMNNSQMPVNQQKSSYTASNINSYQAIPAQNVQNNRQMPNKR